MATKLEKFETLEVGGTYQDRSGEIVQIQAGPNEGLAEPFESVDQMRGYYPSGHFYSDCSTSDRDLIFRVIEVPDEPAQPASDPVNEPSHYKKNGIECIDWIRSALTREEFRGYVKGCMLKYIFRERQKGGDESLLKAAKYAEFAAKGGEG